jgi:predicted Rossmann-fold nucleotide-binding protein
MAALNEGAEAGGGHIVGVIHEMWLRSPAEQLRDGGAHPVFCITENAAAPTSHSVAGVTAPSSSVTAPMREMLVARGKDLQERKRLLVQNADALIVLPGGPGTWDELWEMACARGIGLSTLPIVCVNCDGYYDPFYDILVRAYEEQLTKCRPEELVHFVATAEEAVRWVEACHRPDPPARFPTRSSLWRKSSLLHVPPMPDGSDGEAAWYARAGLIFAAGFVAGAVVVSGRWYRR